MQHSPLILCLSGTIGLGVLDVLCSLLASILADTAFQSEDAVLVNMTLCVEFPHSCDTHGGHFPALPYSNDIAVQGNGEDIIADTNVDVEEDVIQIMEVDALYAAISQLDPVSRYIVHSYYLASEQKSEQEIAEVLGISQPAVNKRKNKVLKKLKKLVIKDRKNLQ